MQLIHNAVRQHLEAFSFVGLITASLEERRRPGRPSLLCRASPEGAGPWATPGPYEQLARFLAQFTHTGDA
jgi:predicted ArsR family transcriptional regulator